MFVWSSGAGVFERYPSICGCLRYGTPAGGREPPNRRDSDFFNPAPSRCEGVVSISSLREVRRGRDLLEARHGSTTDPRMGPHQCSTDPTWIQRRRCPSQVEAESLDFRKPLEKGARWTTCLRPERHSSMDGRLL